jgi:hypothetical protein
LLVRMLNDLQGKGLPAVSHQLLQQLQRVPKHSVSSFLARQCR